MLVVDKVASLRSLARAAPEIWNVPAFVVLVIVLLFTLPKAFWTSDHNAVFLSFFVFT